MNISADLSFRNWKLLTRKHFRRCLCRPHNIQKAVRIQETFQSKIPTTQFRWNAIENRLKMPLPVSTDKSGCSTQERNLHPRWLPELWRPAVPLSTSTRRRRRRPRETSSTVSRCVWRSAPSAEQTSRANRATREVPRARSKADGGFRRPAAAKERRSQLPSRDSVSSRRKSLQDCYTARSAQVAHNGRTCATEGLQWQEVLYMKNKTQPYSLFVVSMAIQLAR